MPIGAQRARPTDGGIDRSFKDTPREADTHARSPGTLEDEVNVNEARGSRQDTETGQREHRRGYTVGDRGGGRRDPAGRFPRDRVRAYPVNLGQRILVEQLWGDGFRVETVGPIEHDGVATLRVTALHGSLPGEELRQLLVLIDPDGEILEVRRYQGGHPPFVSAGETESPECQTALPAPSGCMVNVGDLAIASRQAFFELNLNSLVSYNTNKVCN